MISARDSHTHKYNYIGAVGVYEITNEQQSKLKQLILPQDVKNNVYFGETMYTHNDATIIGVGEWDNVIEYFYEYQKINSSGLIDYSYTQSSPCSISLHVDKVIVILDK